MGRLTITGSNTKIGNGFSFLDGTGGSSSTNASAISFHGSAISIADGTRVMSGPYGGPAITIYNGATLSCTGSSCLYSCHRIYNLSR